MIIITQLIYLHEGKLHDFEEFESIAIPAMKKYGGELLLRTKKDAHNYVDGSLGSPDEIHVVSFPDEQALSDFMHDAERQKVLHLKEASVKKAVVFKAIQV